MANRRGKSGNSDRFLFSQAPKSLRVVTIPCKESDDKTRQYIKKQRHHFADKGAYSQSYGFPSGHVQVRESVIKKAGHWRIDAFELWCWRRLLGVPWTARLKQSILKKISPEYSLEGLVFQFQNSNTVATWCEELTHWKRPWCWERLKAGGEKEDRGWDGWMASLIQWTRVWANSRR